LASLGAPDPRLDSTGSLHYILQKQLWGYTHQDPAASCVKPILFAIVEHLQQHAATPIAIAVANMDILGFFFLLRVGEHTVSSSTSDTQPFTLQDVILKAVGTLLPKYLHHFFRYTMFYQIKEQLRKQNHWPCS
jgi:hypothetical protein